VGLGVGLVEAEKLLSFLFQLAGGRGRELLEGLQAEQGLPAPAFDLPAAGDRRRGGTWASSAGS
jgi:hypothetical protein